MSVKPKRKIVNIDEAKCNGCGLCIPNCAEGALKIIDGKARLISDVYCDGLGACLGYCPQGAITVIEREAEEFSEEEVAKRKNSKMNEDNMDAYLNRNIKDLIKEFPKAGEILTRYNIGCATCSLGSCLFKDIIEIHNLNSETEAKLMYEIEKAIFPDREVRRSPPKIKRDKAQAEIKYSPPIKKLVDEHILIKRFIALLGGLCEFINNSISIDSKLLLDCVDFIRSYADKYHHMKEEDILFKKLKPDLDIIKVMLEDHNAARDHIKSVVRGIEQKNKAQIIQHLQAYKDLLTQHIKKEDEILYPWIDRGLSITEVGRLYSEFNERDDSLGDSFVKKYTDFLERLEETLKGGIENGKTF